MQHTKTSGTGNKIKFALLWIVSYRAYRRKPVLTYTISGNVVSGFGELGEPQQPSDNDDDNDDEEEDEEDDDDDNDDDKMKPPETGRDGISLPGSS